MDGDCIWTGECGTGGMTLLVPIFTLIFKEKSHSQNTLWLFGMGAILMVACSYGSYCTGFLIVAECTSC